MGISAAEVKELRERTGCGIMECKEALKDSEGDLEKAIEHLRKKGLATAAKKAGRSANEGMISSYIHAGGKIGVLVEIKCETDFVARTEKFQELAKDICMHIAASSPKCISREDLSEEKIEKEKEIYRAQLKESGKPEAIIEKIISGKMEKTFFSQYCLLEQPFVKDTDKSVKDLITEKIAQLGENITINRFVRFQLGE